MRWLLVILCSLIVIGESMAIGELLYIVNGKESDAITTKAIDPELIENIELITDDTSIQKYGAKGANGVVIITLKCDTQPIFSDDKTFKEWLTENIKWESDEAYADAHIKYLLKTDGSTELLEISATDKRFKKRVLKAFELSPKWKSPAMNMGKPVEIESTVYIKVTKKQEPQRRYLVI